MHLLKRCRVDALSPSKPVHSFCPSRLVSMRTAASSHILSQVILKKDKTKLVEDMNPFVYSHSIKSTVPNDICIGEECLVKDCKGTVLGRGVFNPKSLYRVRMLALASEYQDNYFNPLTLSLSELLQYRLKEAKELRHSILDLPSPDTTVYRLVNGEGDRLSGLVIDVFNETTIVVQSSAAWTEKYRHFIESSLQTLYANKVDDINIVWLPMSSRLQQEGWISSITEETDEYQSDDQDAATCCTQDQSQKDAFIQVVENGISYQVSPGNGQKTGFYCDQRENRRLMQRFCQGKDVLDLFCNTGGFSLNALVGQGAKSVIAVDSSEEAIQTLMSNLEYNFKDNIGMLAARNDELTSDVKNVMSSEARVHVVKGDVISFLNEIFQYNKNCGIPGVSDKTKEDKLLFDVIICDPPKLAPKKTFLKKAMKRYVKINSTAMRLLRPGGLLLTCSCSTTVAQEPHCFTQILRDAGREAGKSVTTVATMSAGMDHPLHSSYSAGQHLSVVLARIT